jgi:hypothetical protein
VDLVIDTNSQQPPSQNFNLPKGVSFACISIRGFKEGASFAQSRSFVVLGFELRASHLLGGTLLLELLH